MRRFILGAAAILLLCFGLSGLSAAKDIVIDNNFEMQSLAWPYWTPSGNGTYGVIEFDTTGSGSSWCWWSVTWQDNPNYLTQTVAMAGGVTYDVSFDIDYYNC